MTTKRAWRGVVAALEKLHYEERVGLRLAVEAAEAEKSLLLIRELARRAPDVGAARDDLLAVAKTVPRAPGTEDALRDFPPYVAPHRPPADLRDLEEGYNDWNRPID